MVNMGKASTPSEARLGINALARDISIFEGVMTRDALRQAPSTQHSSSLRAVVGTAASGHFAAKWWLQ